MDQACGNTGSGEGWVIFGPPIRNRKCGTCRSCCTAVPVMLDDGNKPANVRCKHLCSQGCSIYAERPAPCVAWSCKWLFDEDTGSMRRPDHGGYIIDPMLDTVLQDGTAHDMIQIWVDEKRPDSHRDPALRAYLAEKARKHGLGCIVRWSSSAGIALIAPCLLGDGKGTEWLEAPMVLDTQEGLDAKLAAVGATRLLSRR